MPKWRAHLVIHSIAYRAKFRNSQNGYGKKSLKGDQGVLEIEQPERMAPFF